ncbi:hypothetical protein USB125703_00970 [Pseudoclavibacter triregionum]|nr:hypothetical protein USB125703_00970 [Pseudoclavibacter triregionum]
MLGSPPLARGAQLPPHPHPSIGGITPARAGSASRARPAPSRPRDHPRSRGEHVATPDGMDAWTGSPPLARGARDGPLGVAVSTGITPARAGSTGARSAASATRRDHPRSRGEHNSTCRDLPAVAGSPPLARGARDARRVRPGPRRITPARAGSTPAWAWFGRRRRDHPRSRGEHAVLRHPQPPRRGSPPLARGAPQRGPALGAQPRITAARAGSTYRHAPRLDGPWDHPRSRGEHRPAHSPTRPGTGSPPLARGARGDLGRARGPRGITPARAGST